ncbi:hypothetical protein T4A_1987 [Trichinella pseudospiralis]|uniref:Uncharacterized protein n=1 Tax=Trichinella pseudospiralis TaxID=6337 RepID=A0A0V1E6P2_TRIPS|nr:hypothetical protein T4E_3736 [Trichinella pseudospiralis]KRY69306.1 hypothetical protein T4A_1987 [Trichinella pseudospiralis]
MAPKQEFYSCHCAHKYYGDLTLIGLSIHANRWRSCFFFASTPDVKLKIGNYPSVYVCFKVQCKVVSAYEGKRKEGAADVRLVYGSTCSAIPGLFNWSKHNYETSVECMNRNGDYLRRFDICDSAGTHIS